MHASLDSLAYLLLTLKSFIGHALMPQLNDDWSCTHVTVWHDSWHLSSLTLKSLAIMSQLDDE